MEFGLLEWTVVIAFLAFLTIAAVLTRRLTRSVADFLVAGRGAGRYLLTTVTGMSWLGAASVVGQFQIHYDAGFAAGWWYQMVGPVAIAVTFSGWVIYRWRSTRVLTQAQLFELRYSRNYRVFAGVIIFIAGILGFCILPVVGARFFVAYCGLPQTFMIGPYTFRMFGACLAGLIIIAWIYTFMGGQITVMVTDFLQGIFCLIVFLAIFIFIMLNIDWSTITEGLAYAEKGKSMVDPFKMYNLDTYNWTYFVWLIMFTIFLGPTHSNMQAGTCSAKTPHESQMAQILGNVRHMTIGAVMLLMPICAFVVLHHPKFAAQATLLTNIFSGYTEQVQRQIQVPLAMSTLMPPILVGAFAAVILAAFITTNDPIFLIYGGMFVQDIILPFRKKALSQKAHIWLLRVAILGIGIVVFFMGMFYDWFGRYGGQELDLQMFWAVTSLITAGVVAAPMVGALYSRWATISAAWITAMFSLVLCAVAFICSYIEGFPLNPAQMTLIGVIILIITYVLVSLFDNMIRKIPPFNLDRLLHRRQYAIKDEQVTVEDSRNWLFRLLHIDKEFTLGDKITYLAIMSVMLVGLLAFLIGTLWAWLGEATNAGWLMYWRITIWYYFIGGIFVTIWISIGGIIDLIKLVRDLKTAKRNALDDGRVVDHQNVEDLA